MIAHCTNPYVQQCTKNLGLRRTFTSGGMQEKHTGGFVIINGQVVSTEVFGLACYFGCPVDSHCINGTCHCNDGFVGNTFDGCSDVDECELGLCNRPGSWCINLRGSFACCTVNSTSSDCIGLEITGGQDAGFRIMNAGSIHGHHKISSASASSSSLKLVSSGTVRSDSRTSSSDHSENTAGLSSHESSGSSHSSSSKIHKSSEKEHFSSGIWSHRGESTSSKKHRGGYRVETVGEWKNYTGHAVIIGRGRLESKGWNLTDLGNGRYSIEGLDLSGKRIEDLLAEIKGNKTTGARIIVNGEEIRGFETKEGVTKKVEEASVQGEESSKTRSEMHGVVMEGGASESTSKGQRFRNKSEGETRQEGKVEVTDAHSFEIGNGTKGLKEESRFKEETSGGVISTTSNKTIIEDMKTDQRIEKIGQSTYSKPELTKEDSASTKVTESASEVTKIPIVTTAQSSLVTEISTIYSTATAEVIKKAQNATSQEFISPEVLSSEPTTVYQNFTTTTNLTSEITTMHAETQTDEQTSSTSAIEIKLDSTVSNTENIGSKTSEPDLSGTVMRNNTEDTADEITRPTTFKPFEGEIIKITDTGASEPAATTSVSITGMGLTTVRAVMTSVTKNANENSTASISEESITEGINSTLELGLEIVKISEPKSPEKPFSQEAVPTAETERPYKITEKIQTATETATAFTVVLTVATEAEQHTSADVSKSVKITGENEQAHEVEVTTTDYVTVTSPKNEAVKAAESTSTRTKETDAANRITSNETTVFEKDLESTVSATPERTTLSSEEFTESKSAIRTTVGVNKTTEQNESTVTLTTTTKENLTTAGESVITTEISDKNEEITVAAVEKTKAPTSEGTKKDTKETPTTEESMKTKTVQTTTLKTVTGSEANRMETSEYVELQKRTGVKEQQISTTHSIATTTKEVATNIATANTTVVDETAKSTTQARERSQEVAEETTIAARNESILAISTEKQAKENEIVTKELEQLENKSMNMNTVTHTAQESVQTQGRNEFESTIKYVSMSPTETTPESETRVTITTPSLNMSQTSEVSLTSTPSDEYTVGSETKLSQSGSLGERIAVESTTSTLPGNAGSPSIETTLESIEANAVKTSAEVVLSTKHISEPDTTTKALATSEATSHEPNLTARTVKAVFITPERSSTEETLHMTTEQPIVQIEKEIVTQEGKEDIQKPTNVASQETQGTDLITASTTKLKAITYNTTEFVTKLLESTSVENVTDKKIPSSRTSADGSQTTTYLPELEINITTSQPETSVTPEDRKYTTEKDELESVEPETNKSTTSLVTHKSTEDQAKMLTVTKSGMKTESTVVTEEMKNAEITGITTSGTTKSTEFSTAAGLMSSIDEHYQTEEKQQVVTSIHKTDEQMYGKVTHEKTTAETFTSKTTDMIAESNRISENVPESSKGFEIVQTNGTTTENTNNQETLPRISTFSQGSTGITATSTESEASTEKSKSSVAPGQVLLNLTTSTQSTLETSKHAATTKSYDEASTQFISTKTIQSETSAAPEAQVSNEHGTSVTDGYEISKASNGPTPPTITSDTYVISTASVQTSIGAASASEKTPRMPGIAPITAEDSRNKLPETKDDRRQTTLSQGSSTNASFIKTTLQETVSPKYATLPKDWEPVTKETYSLKGVTEMKEILTNETDLIVFHCRSSDECGSDAYCERRSGACRCYPGFSGEPPLKSCVDVNECEKQLDDCDAASQCTNIVGSYTCRCKTGYRQNDDGFCVDIDECKERSKKPCSELAFCRNYPGFYKCQCKPGYKGDGYTCIPDEKRVCTTEELNRSSCGRHHLCMVDAKGEIDCGICKNGYEKRSGVCTDINECMQSNICHPNASCTNLMGSYVCKCFSGYKGDGFDCRDINECENDPCHPQANCINTPGSFKCECPKGWYGNGYEECINPADTSCSEMGKVCERTNHTYCLSVDVGKLWSVCECGRNYRYNPLTDQCEDIDECSENRHKCDPPTSVCINTDGGYICKCAPGYEGTGEACSDTDECERGIAGCSEAAYCENYLGSVGCKCAPGFVGDGIHCTPIESVTRLSSSCNEEWRDLCHGLNKTCHINDEDVPQCGSCLLGYQPFNGKCLAIEGVGSCADPQKNDCDPNAECTDVNPGRYFCTCKIGYIGDGRRCDGPNCHLNSKMCHRKASCQIDGSCKCDRGYYGNGIESCEPVPPTKVSAPSDAILSTTATTFTSKTTFAKITDQTEEMSMVSYDSANFGGSPPGIRPPSDYEKHSRSSTGTKATTPTTHISAPTTVKSSTDASSTFEQRKESDEPTLVVSFTSGKASETKDLIHATAASKSHSKSVEITSGEESKLSEKSDHGEDKEALYSHSVESTNLTDGLSNGTVSSKGSQKTISSSKVHWEEHEYGSKTASEVLYNASITKSEFTSENASQIGSSNLHSHFESESKSSYSSGESKLFSEEYVSGSKVSEISGGSKTVPESSVASKSASEAKSLHFSGSSEHTEIISDYTNSSGLVDSSIHQEARHSASETSAQTQTSVIQKCTITDQSPCHAHANCNLENGQCFCKSGYHGDGYSSCKKKKQDCTTDSAVCDWRAVCDMSTRICKCIPGYVGDGTVCAPDPFDCFIRPNLCSNFAKCVGRRCVCNPGYTGDGTECVTSELLADCSSCGKQATCIKGVCHCNKGFFGNGAICIADPDDCIHYPGLCHPDAICNKETRRCQCLRGFLGNGLDCSEKVLCTNDSTLCHPEAECLLSGICQCKKGYTGNGIHCNAAVLVDTAEATSAPKYASLKCKEKCPDNEVCRQGKCQCALGYKKAQNGLCMDIDECLMETHDCHSVATCTNLPGTYLCTCPSGYQGDGKKCSQHHRVKNMAVDCELDGMTLILKNDTDLMDGRIFVRGQTENPYCSKKLNTLLTNESEYRFSILFAHCNVRFEEPDTVAVTVVIQRHPMFITQTADAYDVRCTYPVGVRKVASHVDISEITTTKTIVETGVGPACSLSVTNEEDQVIDTATVGQILQLTLSVHPNATYAILPRNCFAINLETGELYSLTDQAGCAIDTQLFPEWTYRHPSLTTATFRTFKWPDSSMIRFQCDCSACIESCPKVNCERRRAAMMRRRFRFRYAREVVYEDAFDMLLENRTVKGLQPMTYSPALRVNDVEEMLRTQRELNNWKHQSLADYEEPIEKSLTNQVCIRALWITISLLPLLILLTLLVTAYLFWRRKTTKADSKSIYSPNIMDNASSYLKF